MDVFGVFIQMTFTDDDLKRLKEKAERSNTYTNMDCDKALALLSRLEAAELCCQFMWISEHPIDESANEAYSAWRRACGK